MHVDIGTGIRTNGVANQIGGSGFGTKFRYDWQFGMVRLFQLDNSNNLVLKSYRIISGTEIT